MTEYDDKVRACFDAVCARQPKLGANAAEVAAEMESRGWLAPFDTVIDIADILIRLFGRPPSCR